MVQNQRITSFCVVLVALLLLMVNSVEPMPQSEPEIRRLVEIKTVDEKGLVRAHVVAVYEQKSDIEEQKTSSESDGEPKRYQDDDEDSKESSGDSSETYNGESYEMLARDDPLASSNQSSSESSGSPAKSFDSNINVTQNPVDSKSSTVQPTTSQINATTSFPNTASLSTTNIETTTAVPQITDPVTTTATKVTDTREKQNATTLSLNTKTRNNLTTISPRVTEVSSTTPAQTTNAPTTTTVPSTTTAAPTTTTASKPTKIAPTTETHVSLGTLSNASTTARPNLTDHGVLSPTKAVRPSTSINPNVEGQKGPEKKARRKTLFGFVTVEILIALLAGALFSVLLVAFLVYRLKKRNEGSYELSETIALRPKEIDEMGKKKEVFV